MAKKGAAVQLQTDVYTDDDWDKLLDKSGLIIVDVYSDWCGQCSAMSAILKKLKLEIGGDLMHIAAAKCDNIQVLERFRDKSEPTWMFISNRKVVNIMFGANAPKLIITITNELKREKEAREGSITRTSKDPNEPCGEEEERYEKKEAIEQANRQAEEAAAKLEVQRRREEEAQALLQAFREVSVLLAWPHAVNKALEVMQEQFEKYGLSIGQREKPIITKEDLELMEYFADGFQFPEESRNAIVDQKTMAWIVKGGEDPSNIDEVLKAAVYGPSKVPPGDPGYAAYILRDVKDDEHEDSDGKQKDKDDSPYIYGLWCPPNSQAKAMAIRTIFKHLANPHLPTAPEPIPPHIVVAFDAFKHKEVMALAKDYPKEVMRYGFFTDENADTAELIAKTIPKYEKYASTSPTEKLIIQLSKKRSDPVLAFAQLGPSFMSTNAVEGERECKLFFPEGYDVPEEEDVVEEVRKKKKKKTVMVVKVGEEQAKEDADANEMEDREGTGAEGEEVDGVEEEKGDQEDGEDDGEHDDEGGVEEGSKLDDEVVDVEKNNVIEGVDADKATNTNEELEGIPSATNIEPPPAVDEPTPVEE